MANEVWYYRYKLDTGQFWGATLDPNDDVTCGTTQTEPLPYDELTQDLYWTGTIWEIQEI
jgi:hypothetical protein